ncbi:MAG TPA: type I methionyl aminopeptidase [Acidimicrobiales bacterium]
MGGRTREELRHMRAAGRVVAEMHSEIRRAIRPGVTTAELDRIGRGVLERRGARSNFLGYHGFPAVICASPNDVVVHGIPGDTVLEEGDIISIDCGAIVEGWHGDAAFTAPVGEVSEEAARLVEVTRESMMAGIASMVDGGRMGDVGSAVQAIAEAAGFSIVREYVGHGIGQEMHERPEVPNFGAKGKGAKLKRGMTLALEPMVTIGSPDTFVTEDGWTVVTDDGSLAAHWEHTIAITDAGPEILTLP